MIIKNRFIFLSNITLLILFILFFIVDYQYSSDVRRNIKFAEFFINNNFDLFKLIDHLFDMRSIEFSVVLSIFIYSIGLLIKNLAIVFFILNFSVTLLLFYFIKKDLNEKK